MGFAWGVVILFNIKLTKINQQYLTALILVVQLATSSMCFFKRFEWSKRLKRSTVSWPGNDVRMTRLVSWGLLMLITLSAWKISEPIYLILVIPALPI